jgi:hypothetical protein
MSGSPTPRSAKVLIIKRFDVFQHRVVLVCGEIRALSQHKVARLPVGKIDRRDTNCAGSVRQPLDQGGRRKDEEAFHDVLAIEWNSQHCHEHSSTTIWCALDPADRWLQASPAYCLYSKG